MASAFRAARLTQAQSVLNYQTTVANTVLDVQVAYDDVLLAEQQITVQEASVELLGRELADTTRRYDAGTVPRFNVLRAEVELANARPKLIRARNSLRIAKNNLANLLGLNLPKETLEDIPEEPIETRFKGLRWLHSALQLDPHHKATHEALADYYRRMGNQGLAARHKELAQNSPPARQPR